MKSYIPINSEEHLENHWIRHSSLNFAKTDTVAPLYVNEVADALHEMPIAFIKSGDRYELMVVMGLRPNENLFISAESSWSSQYMPVLYRCSPFNLLSIPNSENQSAFCIEADCLTDKSRGEPLFTEAGEVSEPVKSAFELVQKLHAYKHITELFCQTLNKYNLIEPWNLTVELDESQLNVNGLYKINESAMSLLPDEAFLFLRKENILPIIYAQIISTKKVSTLAQRLAQKIRSKTQEPLSQKETFSFEGLI